MGGWLDVTLIALLGKRFVGLGDKGGVTSVMFLSSCTLLLGAAGLGCDLESGPVAPGVLEAAAGAGSERPVVSGPGAGGPRRGCAARGGDFWGKARGDIGRWRRTRRDGGGVGGAVGGTNDGGGGGSVTDECAPIPGVFGGVPGCLGDSQGCYPAADDLWRPGEPVPFACDNAGTGQSFTPCIENNQCAAGFACLAPRALDTLLCRGPVPAHRKR